MTWVGKEASLSLLPLFSLVLQTQLQFVGKKISGFFYVCMCVYLIFYFFNDKSSLTSHSALSLPVAISQLL